MYIVRCGRVDHTAVPRCAVVKLSDPYREQTGTSAYRAEGGHWCLASAAYGHARVVACRSRKLRESSSAMTSSSVVAPRPAAMLSQNLAVTLAVYCSVQGPAFVDIDCEFFVSSFQRRHGQRPQRGAGNLQSPPSPATLEWPAKPFTIGLELAHRPRDPHPRWTMSACHRDRCTQS